ncbi:MAG: hypothetical protein ABJE95_15940 [Byssovorax sp.]
MDIERTRPAPSSTLAKDLVELARNIHPLPSSVSALRKRRFLDIEAIRPEERAYAVQALPDQLLFLRQLSFNLSWNDSRCQGESVGADPRRRREGRERALSWSTERGPRTARDAFTPRFRGTHKPFHSCEAA